MIVIRKRLIVAYLLILGIFFGVQASIKVIQKTDLQIDKTQVAVATPKTQVK